jgi:hypothetical protein
MAQLAMDSISHYQLVALSQPFSLRCWVCLFGRRHKTISLANLAVISLAN